MTNLRDFPEDKHHENGNYHVVCTRCGEQFLGHKRRPLCKVCVQYLKGAVAAPEPVEPRL